MVAAVAEELVLLVEVQIQVVEAVALVIGACLILCLFALLVLRGFWIALQCKNRYDLLVCAGISALLAIQVFLNVAVVTNLIPCTGISLPFFSYGGTALLIQLGEMGIILSASRDILRHK